LGGGSIIKNYSCSKQGPLRNPLHTFRDHALCFTHDLIRKPLHTFRGHASCFTHDLIRKPLHTFRVHASCPFQCRTQISVNSRREVSKSIRTLPFNRSCSVREPSSWMPRRPMSIASILSGVAVRIAW